MGTGNDSDQNSLSTSSSSLYSFLKTSDEFINEDSVNSSEEDLKNSAKQKIAKPVLSDPFWNETASQSNELIYTFQLEERNEEEILNADKDRLLIMNQYADVSEQLKELFEDNKQGLNILLSNLLLELDNDSSTYADDTSSTEESGTEIDEVAIKTRLLKKKAYLEKMNIFMEADAPFPIPNSPRLSLSSKESWNFFCFAPSMELVSAANSPKTRGDEVKSN